MVMYGVFCK